MGERRKHKRQKKRLTVEYGEEELDQRGMASDISIGGMFLDCRRGPSIGTKLHLRVLNPVRDFYVEAEVVRVRRVDPRLRVIDKEGVGLRFLHPDELVTASVPKEDRVQLTNTLICADEQEVRKLLDEQVTSRIIVVPFDEAPASGEMVEFTILIEFADDAEVCGQGRVVQLIGSGEAARVVLAVDDPVALRANLQSYLS